MRYLVLSLILVVIVTTAGLGGLFDHLYATYFKSEQPPATSKVIETLGLNLANALEHSNNHQQIVANWPTSGAYQVTLQAPDETELPSVLLVELKKGKPLVLETSGQLMFHYFLTTKNEVLILSSPLQEGSGQFDTVRYLLTLGFYLSLIMLFLIWLYPLLKRLSLFRKTAIAFGKGELDQRIDVKTTSYIRDIELEFNAMATRINCLLEDVKLLSTAVSHDLRTPLARIRFGVDTLQEVDEPELRKKLELRLSDDIDEMTSLIETLLEFARLEQQTLALDKHPWAASGIIEKCLAHLSNDNCDCIYRINAGSQTVDVDIKYLKMALSNLQQNAIRYGRGKMLISVETTNTHLSIAISDNGPGIPEELKDDITKPFVRGKHNNGKKGHGIGLAIVKRVSDWHSGSLIVTSCGELGGAKFILSLPLRSDNEG